MENIYCNGQVKANYLELKSSFEALTEIGGGFYISDPVNVWIELGRRDGTPGTPYIDFHTDGNPNTDYNVRIIANGNKLLMEASDGVKANNKFIQLGNVLVRGVRHNTNSSTQTITIPARAKTIQFVAYTSQTNFVYGKVLHFDDLVYYKDLLRGEMYFLNERDVYYRCNYSITYDETTGGTLSFSKITENGFLNAGNNLYYIIRD